MQALNRPGYFFLHDSHRRALRGVAVILFFLAAAQLVAWWIPAPPGSKGIANYLPLHTLLETASIVIAMMVFAVGWNTHNRNVSGNTVLLACFFFAIGWLDFSHTVAYGGMPDFVTPNDAEKHLNFWLSARCLAATALLIVAIRPWVKVSSPAKDYLLLSVLIGLTAGINWVVIFHQDWLPHTFIPGQGLTPFKKNLEYVFILMNLVTAALLWAKMRSPQPFNAALLFGAVCTMAMSEFFFTLYTTMTGAYNVLGHIYKVISYIFIYRAVVVEAIESPYKELALLSEKLQELNSSLEKRIADRTAELASRNSELAHTLETLSETRDELVESAKLAALGSLVAGVAHELNTPIGNGLTAASSLEDRSLEFQTEVASGLKRSTLDQFVSEARHTADILVRNLSRAAKLVASFKQVAVDQTSSQRRQFSLRSTISEIVTTLEPTLKKSGCEVSFTHSATDMQLDSYPGPLGQALTNLIGNSIVHGYGEGKRGQIRIAVTPDGEHGVQIEVADDGCGIEAGNLGRVFEPFFTTRLGHGGSGLGLHIVRNIVVGTLGGKISVHSTLGQGATFTIRIPLRAPDLS